MPPFCVADKSGGKFAPKAPLRRAGPASTAPAAAAKPNAANPPPSREPAPSADVTANPAPVESAPHPPPDVVAEPTVTHTPQETPPQETSQKVSQPHPEEDAVQIPIPTAKPRQPTIPTVRAATDDSAPTSAPTPQSADASQGPGETPVTIPVPSVEVSDASKSAGKKRSNADAEGHTPADTNPSSRPDEQIQQVPPKRRKTTESTPATTSTSDSAPSQDATRETTQKSSPENAEDVTSAAKKTRKPRKPRQKRTSTAETEGSSDSAKPRRRRARSHREPTPEGAEDIEISPTEIKMSDLCKDLRTGKVSKREMGLRALERAEYERRQRERSRSKTGTPAVKPPIDNGEPAATEGAEKKTTGGPRMRIVNGEIVIDAASLQVDRHADASREADELENVVESTLTRKINQATYGKRTKVESWDEELTELFYRGLRMFGTDFMMISRLFPGRSRRQIKLKFNNEERKDPERIKAALLGPREVIDIETYSELTNTVYDDPREIQAQLDADRKRIEEQHAREKEEQERLLHNPTDAGNEDKNVLPSIENQNQGHARGRARASRKAAAINNLGGGTEEIIGSIDDLPFRP